jgi:hypothetical protein
MNNLRGALCVGLWWLFDSTHEADHRDAKAMCAECPVLTSCATNLRETQIATAGTSRAGGGPVGTWAGKLIGRSGRGSRPREHSTDRGYYQHRWRGETACGRCKAAHAAVQAQRERSA